MSGEERYGEKCRHRKRWTSNGKEMEEVVEREVEVGYKRGVGDGNAIR